MDRQLLIPIPEPPIRLPPPISGARTITSKGEIYVDPTDHRLSVADEALRYGPRLRRATQSTGHPEALSFEERFGLLVDREWTYRESRHLTRRLKAAKLREPACLEEVDYRHKRGLHQAVLHSLASGQWLTHHQNVIIIGPTGSRKNLPGRCALAHQACRLGFSTRYTRIANFLHELQMAKADGSYSRVLARLAKLPLQHSILTLSALVAGASLKPLFLHSAMNS